jgi:hypothetical protein
MGLTQPPIQCVLGDISPGLKLPGREADHTPPFSVEVKDVRSNASVPSNISLAHCLLKQVVTSAPRDMHVAIKTFHATFKARQFPSCSTDIVLQQYVDSAAENVHDESDICTVRTK